MDTFVVALGPVFASGFALQQLLEILDPVLDQWIKDQKKLILSLISLVVGLVLAFGAGLRVLEPLGADSPDFFDALITALVISAGTEGINSIMKFLGYKKDEVKPDEEG